MYCLRLPANATENLQGKSLKATWFLLQAPIATEVEEVRNYWSAEEYHQEYLAKGGRFGKPQDPSKGCTDPIRCYG